MINTSKAEQVMPPGLLAYLQQNSPDILEGIADDLPEPTGTDIWLSKLISVNEKVLEIKTSVKKLAPTNYPVLIQGDSGTGKELIAHALHGDREGKFIPINCAGLPEALIESELFGHIKGAFTSADKDKVGLLQEAKDGTIFLDEIGDLPISLQAKLLRAIQEMSIRPVGSNKEIPITCRFVCATHHKLYQQVSSGRFREDLFWRISTFTLEIPTLLSRIEDIPLIIKYLAPGVDVELFKPVMMRPEFYLQGNVRSLQQIVIRYQVLGTLPK